MEGGLIGFAVSALLTEVINAAQQAYYCKDECKELAAKLEGMQPLVTEIVKNEKNGNEALKKWLRDFKGLLERAGVITKDCIQETKRGTTKRWLKFWRWKKLPSRVLKVSSQIEEARANTSLAVLGIILSRNPPNVKPSLGFSNQTTPSLIVGGEKHFKNLQTSILEANRKDKACYFGLQGRGGVGKTLLAQRLNNDPKIQETYGKDSIIWITVGLDAKICDLYKKMGNSHIFDDGISEQFNLITNQEEQRTYLKNAFAEKVVLLILDDVWEKQCDHHDMMYWLDLATAPGSTTLITSRSESVLRKAHATIEAMLSLSKEESWKLFCSYAFGGETSPTTIPEKLARDVCEECQDLPLALKVIGSAMVDKLTKEEWRSALVDMKESKPILDSNVDDELFGRLQLSYNELKDDATKICFLYFAAFSEDFKIPVNHLVNIWVAEDLFGIHYGAKEAEDKARVHLETLVKRSLIDWNREQDYVQIHDILRHLALYIIDNAKLGECAKECFFQSGKTCASFPQDDLLQQLKRMSFLNCTISQWPESLQASHLKVCMLVEVTNGEKRIPTDIFSNMTSLKVLNLSNSNFNFEGKFPTLRKLTSLTHLNLEGCQLNEILDDFDELFSIKHLSLRDWKSLKELPENIGRMVNLMELDLSGCGSLKELRESIGKLVGLTKLDLSRCGSLTQLPESIGKLVGLTKLYLNMCGSLMELPESIGKLVGLTELDLKMCGSLKELPESIDKLVGLTKLDLSACGSLKELPESIGKLVGLTKLDLSECGSLKELPESIGKLVGLTKFYLSGCESLMELPESIGKLVGLTELFLRRCGSLKELPESISKLVSLRKLLLRKCGSLKELPKSIDKLLGLIKLDLSWCESLTELPESIGKLVGLTKLELIGCGSLKELPESIGKLVDLTELDLKMCGSLIELPESIGKLVSLTKLDLSKCVSLKELPESIGKLVGLTKLDLSECGSLKELAGSIAMLVGLTKLYLSGCESLMELPKNIGKLVDLTELFLRRCGSLKELPESIGKLVGLRKLLLRRCRSLKELPESIGKLVGLTKLDFSWCESLTELPESIGKLVGLTKLELIGCGSLKELPESIGKLVGLTEFSLRECGSLKELPESIGKLVGLTKLNLSRCKSLKELPESIEKLVGLTELDLRECESLTELPESISKLVALTYLNLRKCGSLTELPENILTMQHLRILK